MSRRLEPTIDEIINTLKRSFIPVILVEGSDDAFIYRYLKNKYDLSEINLQVCGSRTRLFEIYKRKEEFLDKRITYIADKDSYRFLPIPEIFNEVVFTKGYSIENDIYDGADIENYLDKDDFDNFNKLRQTIANWFAGEVEKLINPNHLGKTFEVSSHIDQIVPKGTSVICPKYKLGKECIEPSQKTLDNVLEDYDLNIRGKQLFQMLSRFTSKKGRFSRFDHKNLVEIALKLEGNTNLEELMTQVKLKLNSN